MRRLSPAFIDLVFILTFQFAMLWVLAMVLINLKSQEEPTPKPNTEFIMKVVWPTDDNSDIDTWARLKSDPASLTGYSCRENSVFILHNDNTSSSYGAVGEHRLKEAHETLTIETIKPDTYQFSLYGYAIRRGTENVSKVSVRVTIEKVNPYKLLVDTVVDVSQHEEVPIAQFRIDSEGNVFDIVTKKIFLQEILNRNN